MGANIGMTNDRLRMMPKEADAYALTFAFPVGKKSDPPFVQQQEYDPYA